MRTALVEQGPAARRALPALVARIQTGRAAEMPRVHAHGLGRARPHARRHWPAAVRLRLDRAAAPSGLALRLETIHKCLEEGNDFIFLRVCQAKVTDRLVYVIPVLGHGPARHLFNRSRAALSGLYGESVHIARVIEVDHL